MAAEAYARVNNRIAAVCVTTGPGGTNALTGVLGGWLDSIPMLVVSGQVRYDTTARYMQQFTNGLPIRAVGDQEFDITKAAASMCKYAVMLEKPEDIQRKFKRAITDSDTERCVRFDRENKPGVSNLMSIYSAVTGRSFEAIEAEVDGKGYGAFKPAVGEAVVETLRPIREESERLLKDKAYLESVYKAGAEKASYIANKTLRKVYKKVGFVAK